MPSPFDAWNDIEPPSSFDRLLHSLIGRATFGLSPANYRIAQHCFGEKYIAPDDWCQSTLKKSGSWWPEWTAWLAQYSSSKVAPPEFGAATRGYPALGPAPGRYVCER